MTKPKHCPPCNNDCDQSDTCPARKCPHCNGTGRDASGYTCTCVPAATMGRKYRTTFDEPPGSLPWREYLSDLARSMIVVVAVMIVAAVVVIVMQRQPRPARIDCSTSSFHPDLATEAKAACRNRVTRT